MKDINGKLVYQEQLNANGKFKKSFDFTNMAKGVYFMQIQSDKGSRVEKVIIQ